MDRKNQLSGNNDVEIRGDDQGFLRHSAEFIIGAVAVVCAIIITIGLYYGAD